MDGIDFEISEGECFGFVHRTKGLFWPGFAPPPWVTWVDCAEPRQRGLAAVPAEPGDELPRDGGAF